jgi:hypothetical protein
MSGAIMKQLNGELAQTKSKGKGFKDELWNKMKPASIAKEMPKTQPLRKGK